MLQENLQKQTKICRANGIPQQEGRGFSELFRGTHDRAALVRVDGNMSHLGAPKRVVAQAVVAARYLFQRVEQRLLLSTHALPSIVALRAGAYICLLVCVRARQTHAAAVEMRGVGEVGIGQQPRKRKMLISPGVLASFLIVPGVSGYIPLSERRQRL